MINDLSGEARKLLLEFDIIRERAYNKSVQIVDAGALFFKSRQYTTYMKFVGKAPLMNWTNVPLRSGQLTAYSSRALCHYIGSVMEDWHTQVYHNAEPDGNFDKETRTCIYFRDKYRCVRCRLKGTRKSLTIHHIIPRSMGGGNDLDNLITLCKKCHDYIEGKPLYSRGAIMNFQDREEDAPSVDSIKEETDIDDWHMWVYGGYKNPMTRM